MSVPKPTFLQKAQAGWGSDVPLEVIALAEFADERSGAAAAQKIGYSQSTVSYVISNRYPTDMAPIFDKIRGALLGQTVTCPVWGEIGRHQCLTEQAAPFSPTNSARAECYRECRSGCPHSRLKGA